MLGYIKEFVTHLVGTRNNKAAYAADKCVHHSERCAASVTVDLEVSGRDVTAST